MSKTFHTKTMKIISGATWSPELEVTARRKDSSRWLPESLSLLPLLSKNNNYTNDDRLVWHILRSSEKNCVSDLIADAVLSNH